MLSFLDIFKSQGAIALVHDERIYMAYTRKVASLILELDQTAHAQQIFYIHKNEGGNNSHSLVEVGLSNVIKIPAHKSIG